MINLFDDFRDLLVCLSDAGADFVLVGGHAVAFHGHPRATKVLDILVRATPANAARVYRGLADFGAPLDAFAVSEADFSSYDGILQIGVPPVRIDIINRASGISFDEAVAAGDAITVEGRRVPIIGLAALLKNKRATGRLQDRVDATELEKKNS